MDIELYNDDCFNVFPQIEEKSVDLFVLDLPYNQTACSWDKDIIPLDKMWEHIKRIMKPNGIVIHFCTAKFGYRLIHSNPKWFRYDLIWKKSRKVGFLSANKMPLRQHENIYLFKPEGGTYNPQKTEGKEIKMKRKNTKQDIVYGANINLPDESIYKDRHPTSIIDHENMYIFKAEQGTYNPQKTEGKPYSNGGIQKTNVYGEGKGYKGKKKGVTERLPTSIVDHENLYIFKPEQGTYNPQKTEGKPYFRAAHKYKSDSNDAYGMNERTEHSNATGERHPTSIIDHENIYLFKPEQGTYNPQKTTGHKTRDRSQNKKRNDKIVYGELKNGNNTDDTRHPASIIEQKDLGMIEGGYYRGEGKKPFKRMPAHPTERHPTSVIEHENLYVFSNKNEYNEENEKLKFDKNKILVDYSKKVFEYIGKTKKQIIKDVPYSDHFFRWSRGNFNLPTEATYANLIALYHLDEMPEFIPYETLKEMWEKESETTYNPQKTEGKPYKTIGKGEVGVYKKKRINNENKGDRHPTSLIDYDGDSILIYKNPHKTIHRTQKPVELCEWLIKTYSNEGDTVCDFTMGSGTVGVACYNTKRKFIGIEKDAEIYDLAEKRIADKIFENS